MTVAIGFFDGVHLGHQAILKGADVALTFENHPLSLLAPEKAPRLIMSLEDRIAAIYETGVKKVIALEFTRETAALSAEEFVRRFKLTSVRCGDNWRFGKGGVGDAKWLNAHGIETTVVPYARYKDEIVSSTRIRRALEAGEIEDANAMMGRRFRVWGSEFRGKGKGKLLGYPTLNLQPSTLNLHLPLGVYEVEMNGTKAIANYGLAPTFGASAWTEPVWEIHFLASPSPTPLTSTSFAVRKFIRGERKFASLEDLQRQIALDCATIVV